MRSPRECAQDSRDGRCRLTLHSVLPALVSRAARRFPAPVQRFLKILIAPVRDAAVIARVNSWAKPGAWEAPACCICGGRSVTLHTKSNGFRIVRCREDGLLFASPRPTDLSPYYDERYYKGAMSCLYSDYDSFANSSLAGEWNTRLEELERLRGGPGHLLDVGCATGQFLAQAAQRGWGGAGVELSAWAAAQARTRAGVTVYEKGLPNDDLPSATFDVVTLWDCIEHLSAPGKALEDIHRVLRPGGLLMLSTGAVPHRDPRVESQWYQPPWHLYYFADETIRHLLATRGFDVLHVRFENTEAPAHQLMVVTARARVGPGSHG